MKKLIQNSILCLSLFTVNRVLPRPMITIKDLSSRALEAMSIPEIKQEKYNDILKNYFQQIPYTVESQKIFQ